MLFLESMMNCLSTLSVLSLALMVPKAVNVLCDMILPRGVAV